MRPHPLGHSQSLFLGCSSHCWREREGGREGGREIREREVYTNNGQTERHTHTDRERKREGKKEPKNTKNGRHCLRETTRKWS